MLLLSLGVWVADRTGLMYQIGRALSPVFRPVGFGVPEAVVAVERKKEADSLSKIESITAALNALKNN